MEKKTIEAVHERDLEKLLRSLGLWEKFTSAQIRCSVCGSIMSQSNIGLIYPFRGSVMICCHNISCYQEVKRRIAEK